MSKVAIAAYGAGNLASVVNALERLGANAVIATNANELLAADRVIFPGVGHATQAMTMLKERSLSEAIGDFKQPLLGICLGMQLLGKRSEEGNTTGIGALNFEVKRFDVSLKIPHMGWNTIQEPRGKLFDGIPSETYFYFVHSYYVPVIPTATARCTYEFSFAAAVEQGNFFGVQFHPEKSGDAGMQLLENFLKL
jgi:imidazole glycerol phosphate synthase, glutamine amidotransferase subunit